MPPIRITLAGCSTSSAGLRSASSSSDRDDTPMPSCVTTTTWASSLRSSSEEVLRGSCAEVGSVMRPSCRRNPLAARHGRRHPHPVSLDLPPLPTALATWTVRRPTAADVDAVLALVESVDRATLGYSDWSREDVEADLTSSSAAAGLN